MRVSSILAFSALCLVCLSAAACAAPSSSAVGRSISLVAYNVKSLFDAVDDGTEFREFSVAKGSWDDARYRVRLSNVASAVLAAAPAGGNPTGPDVLCLEEIENARVLEALRAGPLAEARYGYASIAPAEGGPFSVCVLSRLPILASSCHAATTPTGRAGRDILELELDAGEAAASCFFVCHWKSKTEGAEATEEARRVAAALVRGMVSARLAADPGAEIVVCGDFNESPDEFERAGRRYATALMPVEAQAMDGETDASLDYPSDRILVASTPQLAVARQGECVLYSPWAESGGYSYSFRGARERIDGFLLSPGLLDGAGLSYDRFAAASAPFLVDSGGDPKGWMGSSGYSDHLPILLVLKRDAE